MLWPMLKFLDRLTDGQTVQKLYASLQGHKNHGKIQTLLNDTIMMKFHTLSFEGKAVSNLDSLSTKISALFAYTNKILMAMTRNNNLIQHLLSYITYVYIINVRYSNEQTLTFPELYKKIRLEALLPKSDVKQII